MIASFFAAALVNTCSPLSGVAEALSQQNVSLIWAGELHGTSEQPAAFADLICTVAQATNRRVVVALERTSWEQVAWSRYLASSGDEEAKAALISAGDWPSHAQDGRSSQAMLALADRLRTFYQEGIISGVRMIIPDGFDSGPQGPYEVAMGANVTAVQSAHPHEITIVYSGSLHARKLPLDMPDGERLTFAAGTMKQPLQSILIRSGPGLAWNCLQQGCGSHVYDAKGNNVRGLSKSDVPQGYDEIVYTGTSTTASPPASPRALNEGREP